MKSNAPCTVQPTAYSGLQQETHQLCRTQGTSCNTELVELGHASGMLALLLLVQSSLAGGHVDYYLAQYVADVCVAGVNCSIKDLRREAGLVQPQCAGPVQLELASPSGCATFGHGRCGDSGAAPGADPFTPVTVAAARCWTGALRPACCRTSGQLPIEVLLWCRALWLHWYRSKP